MELISTQSLLLTKVAHMKLSSLMALSGLNFMVLDEKKLVSDYDLRYGDEIKVHLDDADIFSIEIDLRLKETRGGHRPVPKPSVGKFICLKSNLYLL